MLHLTPDWTFAKLENWKCDFMYFYVGAQIFASVFLHFVALPVFQTTDVSGKFVDLFPKLWITRPTSS
jgi:hypothetical protein